MLGANVACLFPPHANARAADCCEILPMQDQPHNAGLGVHNADPPRDATSQCKVARTKPELTRTTYADQFAIFGGATTTVVRVV